MTELSFEVALKELEHIVQQLEEGNPSLGESMALFEKGVKLAGFLKRELDSAEKKIEILLKNEDGDAEAHPYVPEEDASRDNKAESTSEPDENGELPF